MPMVTTAAPITADHRRQHRTTRYRRCREAAAQAAQPLVKSTSNISSISPARSSIEAMKMNSGIADSW